MKLKLTIAILLFCSSSSYSQDYMIVETLPLNDSIAFTSLRYGNKDYGYGVLNSKGKMTWQVPSRGYPVGMSKFKNDVIVFYTDENKDLKDLKKIHAAIVDLKTQKITNDKEVYANESKYQFDPFVLNDPAGNFDFLLIRTTARKTGFGAYATTWPEDKSKKTTQLSVIYLDDKLTTQTKDIKGVVLESFFISACAGNSNDLYVCSYNDDQLTVEKFDRDNNLKSKLSTPTSIKDHSTFYPLMKYDSLQGNCIDAVLAYKNKHKDDILCTYRFDFNDQKSFASDETALDKDYAKVLAKMNGEKKLSNFKFVDDLRPVQILETNDKVIVLKEIEYPFTPASSNTTRYARAGSLISIYTKKDLHPERDILIDKYFETFAFGGIDVATHLRNGQLYTATCELTGAAKVKTFLYISNINDGTTEKKVIEKEDAGKGWITFPTTVCWFSNNFITPFTTEKSLTRFKPETYLQSQNY